MPMRKGLGVFQGEFGGKSGANTTALIGARRTGTHRTAERTARSSLDGRRLLLWLRLDNALQVMHATLIDLVPLAPQQESVR